MAYEIQTRRDTAANWTTANPILAQGEQGYETDTNKLKFGDGVSVWSLLPYFGGGSGPSLWAAGVTPSDIYNTNSGNVLIGSNTEDSTGVQLQLTNNSPTLSVAGI